MWLITISLDNSVLDSFTEEMHHKNEKCASLLLNLAELTNLAVLRGFLESTSKEIDRKYAAATLKYRPDVNIA